MLKNLSLIFAFVTALLAAPAAADASTVEARISLAHQRMQVYINGFPAYSWAVSTARRGYRTPVGSYHAIRLERMWYSRKYDMSPMPHSVFFRGGYAIHGTNYIKRLGTPASHGCVRLHPTNAATLYNLVLRYGMSNTRIVVTQ